MNIAKNIQAVGIILKYFNGRLNYTKLLKILYFINRQSLSEKGRAVIDDVYANMQNGVVLSNTYNLIKGRYRDLNVQEYWNSFFITQNVYDLMLRTDIIPEGELSKYEKRIINENLEKYKELSFGQLIDLHHNSDICPEWKDPNNSSIPLKETEILSFLGFSDAEIDFISNDKQTFSVEEQILSK